MAVLAITGVLTALATSETLTGILVAKGDEAPFFVEEKGHDIQIFMKHNKIECNDGDVEGDKINYDDMLIDKSRAFLEKMQIDLVRCGSMFNHTINKTEAMYQTINSSILFQPFYDYSDDMYFAETNSLGGFDSWQSWGYEQSEYSGYRGKLFVRV